MARFIQDAQTGKLIPAEQHRRADPNSATVIPDIEPFISPIDKTLVSSRSKLRDHQKVHEVTAHGEYGENNGQAYFKRKQYERVQRMNGRAPEQQAERIEAIRNAFDTRK